VITARLWAVTQARIRSRNAAERLGANVPSAARGDRGRAEHHEEHDGPAVSPELVSARRISPAAAITSG
jgi:hypothetical protein